MSSARNGDAAYKVFVTKAFPLTRSPLSLLRRRGFLYKFLQVLREQLAADGHLDLIKRVLTHGKKYKPLHNSMYTAVTIPFITFST